MKELNTLMQNVELHKIALSAIQHKFYFSDTITLADLEPLADKTYFHVIYLIAINSKLCDSLIKYFSAVVVDSSI